MKIMVGYDGSNASKAALDVAIEHAKAFKASILAVASMPKATEDDALRVKQIEDELASIKSNLDGNGIDNETHLLIRNMEPGEDLVTYANEQKVDEIVIGVRRRSKVGKLLFGSTAQYITLNANCPVVMVK